VLYHGAVQAYNPLIAYGQGGCMFRRSFMTVPMTRAFVDRIDFTNHYFKGRLIRCATIICYLQLEKGDIKVKITFWGKLIRRALKLMPGDRIDVECRFSTFRGRCYLDTAKTVSFDYDGITFEAISFEKSK
jgi:hypothetical protein